MNTQNLFYHGTQTAIHELPEPFLDPTFARLDPRTNRGLDEGDPVGPHIFLTRSIETARLFTAKSKDQISSSASKDGAYVLYSRKPENLDQTGYVYTIAQEGYASFDPRTYNGRPTNKLCSYEKLDVSRHPPIIVRGLRELMQKNGVQVFYIRCGWGEGIGIFKQRLRIAREQGYAALFHCLHEQAASGKFGLLNAEIGMNIEPSKAMETQLVPTRSDASPLHFLRPSALDR